MATAPAPVSLMRVNTVATSKIHLVTRARIWGTRYHHSIEWRADLDCPAGFLAQKIKRDIKYQFGRMSTAPGQSGQYRWSWMPELTERAEYWEIWEVVVHTAGTIRRPYIYPALTSTASNYATSHGPRTRQALLAEVADQYKRPPATPATLSYWSHDVFEESSPNPQIATKGRFKIKGSVFMLPSGTQAADAWVDRYLASAQRGLTFGPRNDYTGGPLWQNRGDFPKPPANFRVMTRFEAGAFYDVQQRHLTASGLKPTSSITNSPSTKSEWTERQYPLRAWHF